jgi:oxygen-independent coproporphyrinogen-3 oxidase
MASRPGLYLHVPFCSAICPYCDFSVLTGGRQRRAEFVDSLLREIETWRQDAGRWETIDTIYFGGGTPSALEPAELARILAAARTALPIAGDAWIALEANPEDIAEASVRRWREELGASMLSLGIQSFDAGTLRFLGRRHSPEQARQAVELALGAGFPTVSIDLIYGTKAALALARWRRDLEQAVALGPHHISCYQLTIHEGTPFGFRAARGELGELPEAEQAASFELTHAYLAAHGYPAYEVSNFASAVEHQSRHNRKYWDHTPYLGLGPSAHSFDGRRRWWNERKLGAWQRKLAAGERPVAGGEDLGRRELALEEVMLSLRTPAGIDLAGFRRRHGWDLAAHNQRLVNDLAGRGLLTERDGRLVPSLQGLAVADSLARSFDLGCHEQADGSAAPRQLRDDRDA